MADEKKTDGRLLTLANIRDIAVVALIIVIGWRLLNADIKIDIASFSFNDLLSLMLAIFSVWLSVIFYFKANDGSNQFYDNTYRFTKEMSEILGRIEAGFGEKLRHLDDGYHGLREKFDRMPFYPPVTQADVKREEEEIKKKESEQKALIEQLAEKAQLAQSEKDELFKKLSAQTSELDSARGELRRLRRMSMRKEDSIDSSSGAVLRFVGRKMLDSGPKSLPEFTVEELKEFFEHIRDALPSGAIRDLIRFGHLSEESNTLSSEAATYILSYIRERRAD